MGGAPLATVGNLLHERRDFRILLRRRELSVGVARLRLPHVLVIIIHNQIVHALLALLALLRLLRLVTFKFRRPAARWRVYASGNLNADLSLRS